MSDATEVARFLGTHRSRLEWLLGEVKVACEQLRRSHLDVIADVYSRGSLQGGDEFKKSHKIVEKLRARDISIEEATVLALNDIVGLTVVVRYPDMEIDLISKLTFILSSKSISVGTPDVKRSERGYYATHLVCSYYDGYHYNCELQIKTPLHDAWARKTHDLTYKPSGFLDPRLGALMQSIGSTLENLEQQSVLIRDMIRARWNVEQDTRREIRGLLFQFAEQAYRKYSVLPSEEAVGLLHQQLKDDADLLRTVDTGDVRLRTLMQQIDAACVDTVSGARHAWMLAGQLAMLQENNERNRFFLKHAWRFVKNLENGLISSALPEEAAAVPVMLYAVDETDEAISVSEHLLSTDYISAGSERARAFLNMNRLCFITEREYHSPTRHAALRRTIGREVFEGLEELQKRNDPLFSSALLDAIGLARITFATSTAEVRRGIKECELAATLEQNDVAVAEAYLELHLRLGWRRYFDLEIQERQL